LRKPLHYRAALLLAVLWVSACSAIPQQAKGPPTPPATPPFWRVTDTAGNELYLLGTLHVARDANGWTFEPGVREAFHAAPRLIVEADTGAISRDALEALVLRRSLLPEGEQLADHVSASVYEHLVAHLRARDIDPAAYERFKPWMAALTLSELAYSDLGLDRAGGVERKLLEEARGSKEIVSIEGVELQYAMMDELSPALQQLLLEDTLRRMEDLDDDVSKLVDAWQRGDDVRLDALATDGMRQTPELAEFYEAVIFSRNDTMTNALQAQLENGGRPGFAALGVAHLVGPRGIAAQLAARGYLVERLRPATSVGAGRTPSPPLN